MRHASRVGPWAAGLAAALLLAGCAGKAERVQAGLRKAAQYIRDGQWDKARLETRNVLQVDPKNAAAYALSARIAEAAGDYPRAWLAWQQSAELAPDDLDTQLALARLLLLGGETDGAERGLARILARRGDHVGARTLQAAVAARRGHATEAIAALHAIVDPAKPPPVDATLLLASLLAQQGDPAGALRALDAALDATPDSLALLVAAAQVCEQRPGDATLAARALDFHRRATRVAPQDLALWRAWADFHLRRQEIARAEAVLRAATTADPRIDTEAATLALLDFLAGQRGAAPAQAEARAAIAAHPDVASLRLRLAALYDEDGQRDLAERALRELAERDPTAPAALAAQDRLAQRAYADGRLDEALSWLARTLRTQPRDMQALRLRGRLLLARDQPAEAIVDLRTAVHDAPGSPELVGLLAQAHRANGEPQLARDALADAVRFQPDDPALRLLLAADMADAGDAPSARRELDAAIAQAPRDARAYAAKARLALARGDLDTAERTWVARLAAAPDDAATANDLAWLLAHKTGDPAALRRALQLAQPLSASTEPRYLDTLGWIQLRLGQTDASTATLERAARLGPDLPLVQLHLGLALHAAGHRERAVILLNKALASSAPLPDADAARRLLARP
jgi:tetratricopeptide (TPR) repeat protein